LTLKHVRRLITLASDFRVHRVGREVNLSRPRDRALVDESLFQEVRIVQQRRNAGQFFLL